ncbi:uncharacterized protein PAC_02127 [Phialocephala subalpina]|uniref:Uncharacterized protein n=1 Tax=Phialocephala subalpina TaxID=576137 RepID=A0A1L7WHK5_9HELO|nr:uncharacterized protein PAC_02127 [Phialocephala subalpina]
MAYQGWNLDDMRRSGSEFINQTGTLNAQSTDPPMPSFTPINPIPARAQFVSPQKTLHRVDVYDTVEFGDEPAELPLAKSKKGRAQSNKSRAVSVNPLWEYVDEGDLAGQNNGVDFQTTLPKRRKPAATKRTNSLKAPANTLSQFWSQDEEQLAGLQGNEDEQPSSQLTTPPDSANKKRKRTASAKPQPSKPKMGPFKAPTITKPAVSRQKETAQEHIQTKTITCLGHTTSQDQVKLSQTTMDRLKSFRYIPPSATQHQEETPTVSVQNPQSQSESSAAMNADPDGALFEEEINENSMSAYNEFHEGHFNDATSHDSYFTRDDQEVASIAFKHNLTPRNNAFFADATWNVVQMSSLPQYSSPTEKEYRLATNLARQEIPTVLERETNDQPNSPDKSPDGLSHLSNLVQQNETHPLGPPLQVTVRTKASHGSSRYDEPDSSQARAMLDLLDRPESALLNHESLLGQSFQEPSLPLDHLATQRPLHSEHELLDGTQRARDQHEEPSSQFLPTLKPAQLKPCPDPSRDIQVERSDIDDIDMAAEDVSKVYDLTDYDQGLDDSDLMELMTQPVVPATQLIVLPKVGSSFPQEQPEAKPVENGRNKSNSSLVNGTQDQLIASKPSSPGILSPETNDEFPLDDDMEEEMMNLAESNNGVVERFQSPASVQHRSEGSSSGEVYDKSLQFSPPKQRPAAESPTKTSRHTDKDSALHSPSSVPEMPVEEDWSYIRSSAEKHTGSSRPSDRRGASLEEVEEVSPIWSQAKPVPSLAMRKQSSTSQMTTTTITTILDDSHEYEPLKPFARPDFPTLIRDRSPVVGLSPQTFLRVCFRVAEMLKEGARCNALKEDAVIELFSRVTHSSREPGTARQHFEFADLWHDRPPFPNGILTNCKTTGLADTESKIFQRVVQDGPMMARCFGRLKRDSQISTGWLLDIINIRTTDWEEIRWTKRIVGAGLVKFENH